MVFLECGFAYGLTACIDQVSFSDKSNRWIGSLQDHGCECPRACGAAAYQKMRPSMWSICGLANARGYYEPWKYDVLARGDTQTWRNKHREDRTPVFGRYPILCGYSCGLCKYANKWLNCCYNCALNKYIYTNVGYEWLIKPQNINEKWH